MLFVIREIGLGISAVRNRAKREVGGGQHVDIRYRDIHRISRYLAKYLTKDLLMSAPKRSRRVTVSRGICLNEKPKKEHKWDLLRCSVDLLFQRVRCVVEESYSGNIESGQVELEGFVVRLGP